MGWLLALLLASAPADPARGRHLGVGAVVLPSCAIDRERGTWRCMAGVPAPVVVGPVPPSALRERWEHAADGVLVRVIES